MRAAAACLGALLFAGCGGSGTAGVNMAPLACASANHYLGAPLHAALPESNFPATPGVVTSPPLPPSLGLLLDARVADILAQTGAPAFAVAIDVAGVGRWASTQGLARVTPASRAEATTLFYWGSIAKALTPVLVLQLVEEGRLRLDDRLARWYPQMPQAELISIEHLLTHTSGLATDAPGPATPAAQAAAATAEQVLAAAATPSVFCPGTGVSYSNTGYLMLGLIVQTLEQQTFDDVLQRRIAVPLGLQRLRAFQPGEEAPPDLATAHRQREPQTDPGAWLRIGSGNVMATAGDMLTVWQAVLNGRLLSTAAVRRQWARLYPLQTTSTQAAGQALWWYGQGVMLQEWTDNQGRARQWLGHVGGIPTANATVLYDPEAGAYASAAVNSEVPSAALAQALLQVVMDWRSAQQSAPD